MLPGRGVADAIRSWRLLLTAAASLAGLYGLTLLLCLLLWHLAGIDSFGVNYTAPLSDGLRGNLRRALLHPPKPADKFRDPHLRTPDRRRQK